MIEAVGLTKRYGDKTAVHNLSFQVRPGAVTGFLGPNGSGKSTTMRMILGLDNPTAGSVTISGHPYRQLPNAARHVGALLDAKAVHGGRSARSHLLCLAQLSGIPARRVDEVLGVVGLQGVARKRSKGFSLGMGQRLGIAAALLGDPQVLLFDEPVNGLDPEGILWVRNLMKSLAAEGRTVFVSSHLMSEMALTADHLVVIGRGQLLADMSVRNFIEANSAGFARLRTPDTEPQAREKLTSALMEAGGHVLPEPDGALRVTGVPLPRISDIAHAADVRLWELSPHQASLEEAYMRMTQAAVDYRSTIDEKSGLQQPLPPGALPPMPVPGQNQPGWYAPPPPQGNPYGQPQAAAPGGVFGPPPGGSAPGGHGVSGAGAQAPGAGLAGQASGPGGFGPAPVVPAGGAAASTPGAPSAPAAPSAPVAPAVSHASVAPVAPSAPVAPVDSSASPASAAGSGEAGKQGAKDAGTLVISSVKAEGESAGTRILAEAPVVPGIPGSPAGAGGEDGVPVTPAGAEDVTSAPAEPAPSAPPVSQTPVSETPVEKNEPEDAR